MKRVLTLGVVAALGLGASAFAQTSLPAQPSSPDAPVLGAPTPNAPATGTPTTGAPATAAPALPATPDAPATARPTNCASYIALGNSYYGTGKYDSAYVAFRAASECDARSADALLGLGRSQAKLKLYSASIETLKKLIELDSRNVSGYVALAQSYTAQYVGTSDRASVAGNLDAALRILVDADTLNPDSAGVSSERSMIYRLKGDYARALEMGRRTVALAPDNATALYNLGDLYYATGQLPAAVDALQQAVIADPSDPYARAYYGKLLMASGKPDAAKLELAQAERIAPNNAYAVGQYGVFGYLTKDTSLARSKLEQALKLDPLRYPEFYYYHGRLALDGGDAGGARSDLTKAAALASNNSEYFYWLGRAQEVSGDKGAAREAYGQAVQLNPGYKIAQDALSRVK